MDFRLILISFVWFPGVGGVSKFGFPDVLLIVFFLQGVCGLLR